MVLQRLHAKWPGVFKGHRRKNEVMMRWDCRQPRVGTRVAKRFDSEVAALTPALNRPHVVCATTMPAYAAASTSATATPAALRLALTACKFTHAPDSAPPCGAGVQVFAGEAVRYLRPDGEDGALWKVEYDDGDEEDFDEADLDAGEALYSELGLGGGQGAGARAEGADGGAKEEEEEEEG